MKKTYITKNNELIRNNALFGTGDRDYNLRSALNERIMDIFFP